MQYPEFGHKEIYSVYKNMNCYGALKASKFRYFKEYTP